MAARVSKPRSSDWERGHMAGVAEGYARSHKELLDMLEVEYMKPELDTKSPKGRAIIELAGRLGEHLRTKIRG